MKCSNCGKTAFFESTRELYAAGWTMEVFESGGNCTFFSCDECNK